MKGEAKAGGSMEGERGAVVTMGWNLMHVGGLRQSRSEEGEGEAAAVGVLRHSHACVMLVGEAGLGAGVGGDAGEDQVFVEGGAGIEHQSVLADCAGAGGGLEDVWAVGKGGWRG